MTKDEIKLRIEYWEAKHIQADYKRVALVRILEYGEDSQYVKDLQNTAREYGNRAKYIMSKILAYQAKQQED